MDYRTYGAFTLERQQAAQLTREVELRRSIAERRLRVDDSAASPRSAVGVRRTIRIVWPVRRPRTGDAQ